MIEKRQAQPTAGALRKQIIETCSRNGGHLAASLGAVELALALHAAFETPRDSIVWDVGHQSYAHKLLTARADEFHKLRKRGGLSGFPSREESVHDVFGTGHSSTSISAALGIAEAKRINKDDAWTVAVIGDGGLTAGLAFEALNQAGAAEQPRLVIVVNDNSHSINRNVGALEQWAFGAEREPRKFFESLGFEYSGPMDGHDVEKMRTEFVRVKAGKSKRVNVIHVLTTKGKGFEPAENEPVRFHGVGPFDKTTGATEKRGARQSFSKTFGEELTAIAANDQRIVAITAAMTEGTGLVGFAERFPDRFYDVGIAEAHALVFAGGLATQGIKPVVAIYSTFLQRAIDSVIHDLALQNLDVTLAIDRAGLVGADGPTHHGIFDVAFLRAVPGVTICAPSSREELRWLLREAVGRSGVKAIRYPRATAPERKIARCQSAWGRATILSSPSEKVADKIVIWALGNAVAWVEEALKLVERATRERVLFVDARFAKPIDIDTLGRTLEGAKGLLTIEDGVIASGFGSAVLEAAHKSGFKVPVRTATLGVPERWVAHAETHEQRADLGLSDEQIARAIEELTRA